MMNEEHRLYDDGKQEHCSLRQRTARSLFCQRATLEIRPAVSLGSVHTKRYRQSLSDDIRYLKEPVSGYRSGGGLFLFAAPRGDYSQQSVSART